MNVHILPAAAQEKKDKSCRFKKNFKADMTGMVSRLYINRLSGHGEKKCAAVSLRFTPYAPLAPFSSQRITAQ